MTEPYDPLKDVVSDGFVDLNTATKPAPIASVYTGKLWPTFWRDVGIVAMVLAVIIGLLYLAYLRSKPVVVDATKPAIADMGIPISKPTKQFSVKTATKKKADKAINMPAVAEIIPVIPVPVTPKPLTPAEQDFANRLANFESKSL